MNRHLVKEQQDRRFTDIVTLWFVCLTILHQNNNAFYVVVELNVTVIYIMLLSVAQQCCDGKLMSPITMLNVQFFQRNCISTNFHSFTCCDETK
jgi:hypothetical protein